MEIVEDELQGGDTCNNGTNCDHLTLSELESLLLVRCIIGAVCSLFCAIVIAIMIFGRLFTLLTHRLVLNVLLGMFFHSFSTAIQLFNIWWHILEGKHAAMCVAEAFFLEYSLWVVLLSTLMVTPHLTMMVLFPSYYLNIGKLSLFYILFPWLFPLLVVWIPLIHNNYGIFGSLCWIKLYYNHTLNKEVGMTFIFTFWYGEHLIGLILNNIGLVIILIVLCKRAYQEKLSLNYKKALKQTLPLIMYPIILELLGLVSIVDISYQASHHGRHIMRLSYMHAIAGISGAFIAPIFTLLYLLSFCNVIKKNIRKWRCLKCCFNSKNRERVKRVKFKDEESKATARLIDSTDHLTHYGLTVTYPTTAHFPRESEVDDEEYGTINS